MGALRPKDLWEGVQFQVKEIVYSIFNWDEGQFHFEESTLPEKERITVDLDVRDLLLAGLRRVDASGRLQARYPESDALLERVEGEEPATSSRTRSTSSPSWTASAASSTSPARARSATTRR